MSDNPIVYPLPIKELMKLWLEYGSRLHIASIGEEGTAAISADTAMLIACNAVAIGASALMVAQFNEAFLDPGWAAEEITARAQQAVERATTARAASADRTAEIYAKHFGITDPPATPSGRA